MPTPTHPRAQRKLTPKQQLFVEAYLGIARSNGAEAARLAGYKGNEDTLKSIACENLTKRYIKSAIAGRLKTARRVMGADDVLAELSAIAEAAWAEFLEIATDDGPIVAKLRLADKLKALELLGKHHKLFVERREITGADGDALRIEIADPWTHVDEALERIAARTREAEKEPAT